MDVLSFFLTQHGRLHAADVGGPTALGERFLGGLTDEQMRQRPVKGLNSIAWLVWHMARTEDVAVNLVVTDGRQILDDEWLRRLGVPRRDIGTGMSDEEVTDLSRCIDLAAVRAYRSAVGQRTRNVAQLLAPAAWDEMLDARDTARAAAAGAFGPQAGWVEKAWQRMSRGTRLGAAAISHNAMHLGEVATVRGQAGLPIGM